ncbi:MULTISPECIES: hypothetical protein [Streptomyces]|uniref:ATP-binding protein n=1 Tax=Streptomyces glycanivorans TaxID=3033808 RepID=A0ABY9JCG8_9ACTN|nr:MULTISPECIES: hypothetical protein [unclassified Streptomyces]WSQ77921.1 hypothetical protein OG725_12755 [Streptomyces sp. NBC_01213]TXS17740.1 hypothetical protein EAO68_08330 [Streptomyces sp. wa22]WLQ64539.1 hypothetical protein P8A20_13470 [Streptomyces sp. Alt3]WSQ85293.1 hypothetical protein OG722_13420 [Streptomyces sp. NBC_01212]WSR08616.1 hypothetical protein OG265_22595 [Streptomyces sp. NBC_01208]
MKQSAVRTLGVAALGAAFAAAGAGSASAVAVPVDSLAGALPANVALDSVTDALPAVQKAAGGLLDQQQQRGGGDLSAPGTNLLGGLPAGGLTGALPIGR